MKTLIAIITAASFAASAVHADEAQPQATGTSVAVSQQLDSAGLGGGLPFFLLAGAAFLTIGIIAAVDDDDDNNSTTGTN